MCHREHNHQLAAAVTSNSGRRTKGQNQREATESTGYQANALALAVRSTDGHVYVI